MGVAGAGMATVIAEGSVSSALRNLCLFSRTDSSSKEEHF